jgi:hypothetical protein
MPVLDISELMDAIDKLPAQMQREADQAVRAAARRTASRLRSAYRQARSKGDTFSANGRTLPKRHLADAVTTKTVSKSLGTVASRVIVNGPHAHLYEYGTQMRATKAGANRGSSPPHPTLIPVALDERRTMVDDIVEIVTQAGFEVKRSV